MTDKGDSRTVPWGSIPTLVLEERRGRRQIPTQVKLGRARQIQGAREHWVRWFRTPLRDNVLAYLTSIFNGQFFY